MKPKIDHSYLIENNFLFKLESITILNICKFAYQIKWNDSYSHDISWHLKKGIHEKYEFIEDITGIIDDKIII